MPLSATAATMTPVTAPSLPPVPQGAWWNDTQWAVMWALLDAALAPIVASDGPALGADGPPPAPRDAVPGIAACDRASVHKMPRRDLENTVARVRAAIVNPPDAAVVAAFLANRPSDNPAFVAGVLRTVSRLSPVTLKELGGLLTAVSGPAGALLLTGYCTPVHKQPVHVREAILRSWSEGWIAVLRVAAKSIRMVAQTRWVIDAPVFQQATGFVDAPRQQQQQHQQQAPQEPPYAFKFLQFDTTSATTADAPQPLAVLETDVVIVGSGCGGAVCAQVLAAAGHRVVVVEKGYHVPQKHMPMSQADGATLLFENGGVLASQNPCVTVLAGAGWGGGGTINWSACLRTPDAVRREWANAPGDSADAASDASTDKGMAFVTSPAYDACMDRVCAFMGVNDKPAAALANRSEREKHAHRSNVILDGATSLGFDAAPLLQNARGGQPHDDGYCHLGCGTGEKRGPSVSWLPAAADAGAQFIEGLHVERILFDGDDGVQTTTPPVATSASKTGAPQATGIVGTWTARPAAGTPQTRRVVVRAKRVIVSCGSLWSPLVLMKSGLTNPQIGKNLHLHPCYLVGAFFDEETKPVDKGILTTICTSFVDLDDQFHGPRLQGLCMVPYLVLANLAATDSLDFKLAALRYRHLDGFIALTRDRDSGRVAPDPTTGQPVVHYNLSPHDREHAVEGAIGIARLCHAAGANEIRPFMAGVPAWRRSPSSLVAPSSAPPSPPFEQWLADLRRAGQSASPLWGGWSASTPFASAHQMGTCRMGADGGNTSVVDPHGRVWGTRGLYVADASVLPSASGANPMVTVMALADWIAQGIAADLRG